MQKVMRINTGEGNVTEDIDITQDGDEGWVEFRFGSTWFRIDQHELLEVLEEFGLVGGVE